MKNQIESGFAHLQQSLAAGDAGGMPAVMAAANAQPRRVRFVLPLAARLRSQLARLFPAPQMFLITRVPASGVCFTPEPDEAAAEALTGMELSEPEANGPLMGVQAECFEVWADNVLMSFIWMQTPQGVMPMSRPDEVNAMGLYPCGLMLNRGELLFLYRHFQQSAPAGLAPIKWLRARALFEAAVGLSLRAFDFSGENAEGAPASGRIMAKDRGDAAQILQRDGYRWATLTEAV